MWNRAEVYERVTTQNEENEQEDMKVKLENSHIIYQD